MKQEIKLNRTDDRPVAFWGEEIINETTKDRDATRWWTIRVFRTDDGYMVGIARITCWKNERDDYWAYEARTKSDVGTVIKNHLPQIETPKQAKMHREYLDLTDRVNRMLNTVESFTKESS